MRTSMRAFGASLQIGLAGGFVMWVMLGHRSATGLAWWLLALAVPAMVSEWAWRRGHHGDLASVARIAGLLMLLAALGLFLVTLGIEAMVPSLDF